MDASSIQALLHAQVQAWNAGDKEGFLGAYRQAAPEGLLIEYVGRGPAGNGWPVLEGMWAQQGAKIEIEEVLLVVNGLEAACHNRNKLRDTTIAIETIELYDFRTPGRLAVRYFIKQG